MAVDDFGGSYRHNDLADLTLGDPHTQYAYLSSGTLANRPNLATGRTGRLYLATDGPGGPVLYVQVGNAWSTSQPRARYRRSFLTMGA
jgi:hypothetical protein